MERLSKSGMVEDTSQRKGPAKVSSAADIKSSKVCSCIYSMCESPYIPVMEGVCTLPCLHTPNFAATKTTSAVLIEIHLVTFRKS